MDALSWFALGIIFFVVLVLAYGIIALHDVPYHIAKARNHPHQDAIHAGGWISLFTLHAIWPLLWVWAFSYDPERGYFGRTVEEKAAEESAEQEKKVDPPPKDDEKLKEMEQRILMLEARLCSQDTIDIPKTPAKET